jgi:LacI family transcriptional regulator
VPGDFTQASGFEACRTLIRRVPTPTAIFAANDAMAIGALAALHEAGRRVPGDVAVAGFDDIPTARYAHPPLSTVRVDISGLGERATRRLLDAVGNGRQRHNRRETLPVTLVIRESCGGRGRPAAPSPRKEGLP